MKNNKTKLKIFLAGIAGVMFVFLVYVIFASIGAPRSGFIGTIVGFQFQVTGLQCFDGNDNDGDGLIDYPADPGCDSINDDDETDIVTGGGDKEVREEEEIITPPSEEIAQIDEDIPERRADIPAVIIDEEDVDEDKPPSVERAAPTFIPDFVIPVPILMALIAALLGTIWYDMKRRKRQKRQRQFEEIEKEAK